MEWTKRNKSSAPLFHGEVIPRYFRKADVCRYRSNGCFRDQKLSGLGFDGISSTRGKTWIVLSPFGLRGASIAVTTNKNEVTSTISARNAYGFIYFFSSMMVKIMVPKLQINNQRIAADNKIKQMSSMD
jgi:hypothetical protein